jgi:hypothetical protein
LIDVKIILVSFKKKEITQRNYMEQKIKNLITELKEKNQERSEIMNRGTLSDYNHTVVVHTYNNTLDIIKKLEEILK